MTAAGTLLSFARALKVNRGEEGRVSSFFLLHVLISVVIGMISTVVDSLVISRRSLESTILLYIVSAVLLGVIGLFYAGITDRIDKRRLFTRALLVSFLLCLAAAALLVVHDALAGVPMLLTGLFVWRFIIGIVLLLLFWDLAPFYFNARQGKRLFPLLAMGGAIGYSGGSLLVVPMARILPWSAQFLVIAVISLSCVLVFRSIRLAFPILDSPRYRDRSILQELHEGFAAFRGNGFLRAVGSNTVLFGILAGLIILTYNSVVDARTDSGTQAASLMGYQRAVATLLQAVVLTKVMSQSALGGRHGKEVAKQTLFFILGIGAFAISMVGVADFTRQIEVALMSPAAMAAFAFLPSRYRGRVMVLNNIVAAAAGILTASVIVLVVSPFAEPRFFIYPIALLMVARLGFNFVLNRRYVALLSESLLADNRLNLKRLEENSGSILRDETLLVTLRNEMERQNRSTRVFIVARLAGSAQTPEDVERLEPFFHSDDQSLQELRLKTLSRIDYDRYEEEIRRYNEAPWPEVRLAARLAELTGLYRRENREPFQQQIDRLVEGFHNAQTPEQFRETVTLALMVERATGRSVITPDWDALTPLQRQVYLESLAEYPSVHGFPVAAMHLGDELLRTAALKAIQGMPESFLLDHRGELPALTVPERLQFLEEIRGTHPVLAWEEGIALLKELLPAVPAGTETVGGDGADALDAELFRSLQTQGGNLVDAALLVLGDPTPIPPELRQLAEGAAKALSALYPPLMALRYRTSASEQGKYHPLLVKLLDEQVKNLSLFVLTARSLELSREDDRLLAATICRDIRGGTGQLRHNALEFVETRTEGEMRTYLMLYLESLTIEEKRMRLMPLLKGRTMNVDVLLGQLEELFAEDRRALLVEIVRSCRSGVAAPTR